MRIRGHVQHVRKLDTWKANIHEMGMKPAGSAVIAGLYDIIDVMDETIFSRLMNRHGRMDEKDLSFDRPCVICGRMLKVIPGCGVSANVDGGVELMSNGEYGSTGWDEESFGDDPGNILCVVICDECIESKPELFQVRPDSYVHVNRFTMPVKLTDYNERMN